MPLPEGGGAVAVVAQDPRQRSTFEREHRGVAGEAAGELAHRPETDRVVVPCRQQRRARRRAQRGDVEPVVPQPRLGQPRVVRGLDRSPERARIPEPGVVDQHQQHVRRALRRFWMTNQVPVRLRTPKSVVRRPAELRSRQRQCRAVRLSHCRSPGGSSAAKIGRHGRPGGLECATSTRVATTVRRTGDGVLIPSG